MYDVEFFQKYGLWNHQASLFDSMPGFLYFAKDTQLRIVALNQRLANKLGLKEAKDALGKTDDELLPKTLAAAYKEDDLHVIQTGETILNKVELYQVVKQTGR
ncbi:PAS domain-containing protein [Verrucomicrobiaceae bacterium N1E253]|uniref:PAS domain-containing protein n=2 Tax=Oceaniferula marina TaxID=2748318 RepID=A0A851GJK8_9BACT|nr:PAS domain-containing protein [Oceaniferula marina]